MFDPRHKCAMPSPADEVEMLLRGYSIFSNIRVFWMKIRLVSPKFLKHMYKSNLKCYDNIAWERKRMMTFYPCSVHPFSPLRIWWMVFLFTIGLVRLIIIPGRIASVPLKIVTENNLYLFAVLDIFECPFILDLIMNFFTGYYDIRQGEIILDLKSIRKHYLCGTFFIELISNVPDYYTVFWLWPNLNAKQRQIWTYVAYLKTLRVFILFRYLQNLFEILGVNYSYASIVTIIYTMFGFIYLIDTIHVALYLHRYIALDLRKDGITSIWFIFAESIYNGASIINFSSLGYVEKLYLYGRFVVAATYFVSFVVQIWLLSRLLQLFAIRNSSHRKYADIVNYMQNHSHYKELPKPIRKQLLKYYDFHFQETYFNEDQILLNLSNQLRQSLIIENCRQLIRNVRFLQNIPIDLVLRIAYVMHVEDYLEGEVVIYAHTQGDCMYFIATGRVAVYTPGGDEVCHLEDGDHFGEVAVLLGNQRRTATVIAIENCKLYRLEKKDFLSALKSHPDKLEELQKIAADRLQAIEVLNIIPL